MNPLVSIIVPVHNMESYLRPCLASITSQSLRDIEVIVVDDCCTDTSHDIAAGMAALDSRIRLITNKYRMGPYDNRKIGVGEAHAPLVQFVDADDWLEPYATEMMYNTITDLNTDLVQMRSQRIVGKVKAKYGIAHNPDLDGVRMEGDNFLSLASFVGMDSYISPSCCDKMYRRELLKDAFQIDYTDLWGEDQIMNIQYLRVARSMAFVDYTGYNYRWGGESTRYKYEMLHNFKNVWYLKKLLGMDRNLIDEELRSLLRYHIRQLSTDLSWTREAIVFYVSKELEDPIWGEIGLETDAMELVKSELSHIKKSPLKYLAKRLIK